MLGIRAQLVLRRLMFSDAVLCRVVKIGVEERTRTTMKSESLHSRKRVKVHPDLQSYRTTPFFFVFIPTPSFAAFFNPTAACC